MKIYIRNKCNNYELHMFKYLDGFEYIFLDKEYTYSIRYDRLDLKPNIEELSTWCEENIQNKWIIDKTFFCVNGCLDIYLSSDEDLLLFKLIWM